MGELKSTALVSKIAGLALCGFMTACNQSGTGVTASQEPSQDKKSVSINDTVINMAFTAEAKNTNPTAEDCNYMIASILIPSVGADNSADMKRAKNIIFNRCPN